MTKLQVDIGKVKQFWSARPCNIKHSPKPPGTKEYFEEVRARKYFVEPHILGFATFPRWKDKYVLECGCGIGTDTIEFARAGAQVVAVDISEPSLALARQRASLYAVSNRTRFFTGDMEHMAAWLPKYPYALIYSFGAIHHTPDPVAALRQMRQLAHDGTTLRLMVYHKPSWKGIATFLRHGWGKMARFSEAQEGCPITHTYTVEQVKDLLLRAGWTATFTSVTHIFPYKVADYIEYRYVKPWYFKHMPERWFHWLEGKLGWHLLVEARTTTSYPASAAK